MEGKISQREKIVIGILTLLLVTGGVWRAVQVSGPKAEIIQGGYNMNLEAELEKVPEMITVHLIGAVKSPGIYKLPVGSRIYELLELGGGFSEDADHEALNQARPLLDGEQIYVHKIGEAPGLAESGVSALVNINRATVSELTALPGIGEVRANQIVAHREKHGYFTTTDQIKDVSGIGENTFNTIADQITIY